MEEITKIEHTESIGTGLAGNGSPGSGKQKKKRYGKPAGRHLDALKQVIKESEHELEAAGSPFRIMVYQEGEDVFIDIVTIDESGRIESVFKHDISHDELDKVIAHIKTGRGLLLDSDI